MLFVCFELNNPILETEAGLVNEVNAIWSWSSVQRWVRDAIRRGIKNGFMVDEAIEDIEELLSNSAKDMTIEMFLGRQENWDCHYKIIVEAVQEVA